MYHSRGGCRQPRLRFFTWSNDLKTKLTIELCMSNNTGGDNMLIVKCRPFDEIQDTSTTTKSFLVQNSAPSKNSFKLDGYRVWFDFNGRPDLTGTWSFIGLDALNHNFTQLFASKLDHNLKIVDHALTESFE